jgi:hypothetical protein
MEAPPFPLFLQLPGEYCTSPGLLLMETPLRWNDPKSSDFGAADFDSTRPVHGEFTNHLAPTRRTLARLPLAARRVGYEHTFALNPFRIIYLYIR